MDYEPGNSCVRKMLQKSMLIMETKKNLALFFFNSVLRNDEVGGGLLFAEQITAGTYFLL